MENIALINIKYIYQQVLYLSGEITYQDKILEGIEVTFDYKKISNCTVLIGTDKELTIEDIRKRILEVIIE